MAQLIADGRGLLKMSVAEWQVLDDPIGVGFVNDRSFAEPAATLRVFAREQMASAGVGAQHFAGCGDLETFGYGFLCFDAFGSSHKVNSRSKRAGNIGTGQRRRKRYFGCDVPASVSSRMVADDVRRRLISGRTPLPPRDLGGYGSCDGS
jgi:hypothetical protein